MKKGIVITTALLLSCAVATAQVREYGRDRYEINLAALYRYDTSSSHHGGIEVEGFLPVHKYFEADIHAGWNGPGTMHGALYARPKLPLPCGELFLDAALQYRSIFNYQTSELVTICTVGYRMDYVNARFGILGRTAFSKGEESRRRSKLTEPVCLAYRVSFSVRPQSSRWNAGGGVTNITPYECERTWQPLFFINGWYSISDRLRLNAQLTIKPTGMFHSAASFYGARATLGVSYSF